MSTRRQSLKLVLCATLTADGKLDAAGDDLPRVLLRGGGSSGRHPWAVCFDRASAVLLDEPMAARLALAQAETNPLLVVTPAQTLDRELDRLVLARLGGPVWCFGEGEWCRALLDRPRVDALFLRLRPKLDGRRGSAALSGVGGEFFPASVACRLVRMEVSGDECFLHYRVRRGQQTAGGTP